MFHGLFAGNIWHPAIDGTPLAALDVGEGEGEGDRVGVALGATDGVGLGVTLG